MAELADGVPLAIGTTVRFIKVRSVAAGFLLFIGMSASAYAQSEGKFAVGAQFSQRVAGDSTDAKGNKSVGLTWRIGHGHEGWGWRYGLGWYSTDVGRAVGGQNTEMGELKVRPFMGGYGYTHITGRNTISADLMGGYALSSFNPQPGFSDAYRDRLASHSVDIDAANTFAVRPGISFWHDLGKKVGLNVSANYTVARPRITVTSSTGTDARRQNADMFALKIGLVYSVYPR